jgi:hypothetical protein
MRQGVVGGRIKKYEGGCLLLGGVNLDGNRQTSRKKEKSLKLKGVKHGPQWCRNMGDSKKKPVTVDGVRFDSRKDAAILLGIPESTVGHRIKSASYPNWKYV